MEPKASTAALEPDVHRKSALRRRRIPRHPAGGSRKQGSREASKDEELTRGAEIQSEREEEAMRGWKRIESRTRREVGKKLRAMRAVIVAALLFVAPVVAAAGPVSHKETRIPRVDRRAIENLQRWVNGGHEAWCKDAREVATMELHRVAPEFSGDRLDLVSLPANTHKTNAAQAEFSWTSLDGSASYQITVQRYDWLKPLASSISGTVWVPSRVEITRADEPAPQKRIFPELPKA
jgi:hypothetical protein